MVSFTLGSLPHGLVAAILGGVRHRLRNGCFCAHPLLMHLLGLCPDAVRALRSAQPFRGPQRGPGPRPGQLRPLQHARRGGLPRRTRWKRSRRVATGATTCMDRASGAFAPRGWQPDPALAFSLALGPPRSHEAAEVAPSAADRPQQRLDVLRASPPA